MKQIACKVKFITPAFLGNAEQVGQWRTPPFKALLRQWWRAAYAAEKQFDFDIQQMRQAEGQLFGHAWLENDKDKSGNKVAARKSEIRLRLKPIRQESAWEKGSQQGVNPLAKNIQTSYAWFGISNRGPGLADKAGVAANNAESQKILNLSVPDEQENVFIEIIKLINFTGSMGSRRLGGWGSLQMALLNEQPLSLNLQKYILALESCLEHDWSLAIAKDDNGPMVWQSKDSFSSWSEAMGFIAARRKEVRQALKLNIDLRPALGFASGDKRMASPLTWKIVEANDKFAVRVVAMPHQMPQASGKNISAVNLLRAWNIVSATMDATNFTRMK